MYENIKPVTRVFDAPLDKNSEADYNRLFEEAEKRAEDFRAKIKAESTPSGTIAKRRNTHGDFYKQATCSIRILNMMMGGDNWKFLPPDMQESLMLIAVKIGRILTGAYDEPDHWHDISGYALLIENKLKGLPSNGEAAGTVWDQGKAWSGPKTATEVKAQSRAWDEDHGAAIGQIAERACCGNTRG